MFNPLAIGVTLGGLLLDVVAPRPKPRAGISYESSLLSQRAVSRTPWPVTADVEYDDTRSRAVRFGETGGNLVTKRT